MMRVNFIHQSLKGYDDLSFFPFIIGYEFDNGYSKKQPGKVLDFNSWIFQQVFSF